MKTFLQFQDFRALQNEESHSMSNNFRAIQPLGDRVVLYNVKANEKFIDDFAEKEIIVKDIEQLIVESEKLIAEAVESTIHYKHIIKRR